MQIAQFAVNGLFGVFDRVIPFGTHAEEEQALSIVLLHGPNGSGKTTSLRMIDGMMALDFNVFRETPFKSGILRFSTGDELSVLQKEPGQPLRIRFRDSTAILHPHQSGPYKPTDERLVDDFRDYFFSETHTINFEFIHTGRKAPDPSPRSSNVDWEHLPSQFRHSGRSLAPRSKRHKHYLAQRVARFIANAQVNYRRFFRSNRPDFLSAIIERLQDTSSSDDTPTDVTAQQLLDRLAAVRGQENDFARLGVERDRWDFPLARDFLAELSDPTTREGLSVMTAATEVLESRVREKRLLSERLLTFERIVNGYFRDKEIAVDARRGFVITSISGKHLAEEHLSSGEYHLLSLMVAALETQRRGTVLAIDEPELSMHISWQRRLIDSLLECASNASPQLLLATHSPDIVGEYRDYLVEFGNIDELRR